MGRKVLISDDTFGGIESITVAEGKATGRTCQQQETGWSHFIHTQDIWRKKVEPGYEFPKPTLSGILPSSRFCLLKGL